ncbi:MAG: hypothetical protein J6J38_07825 [Lachnospiraceae bacterium]|nr:hypothetical protein [Lachnospiraceae bacterium]
MARINVQNAAYAVLKENTTSAYEMDEIHPLPGLRSIDLSLLMASGTLYGDGVVDENVDKITGAQLKIDINKIPIEDRARMNGAHYDGFMDVTTDDKAPEVAFYFETESSKKGGKEQLWLVCGKVQPIGMAAKQTEDNVTFSTDTMTVKCTRRQKDRRVLRLGDTENKKLTDKDFEEFKKNPDYTIPKTEDTGSEGTTGDETEGN